MNHAQLPLERGPVSRAVLQALTVGRDVTPTALGAEPLLQDEDVQLALWVLYELHYGGLPGVPDAREWDLSALALRASIERRLERELREATREVVQRHAEDDLPTALLAIAEEGEGPPLARHLQRDATREEALDYLRQRSLQQLKESDPQSFLLPRLRGRAKVALAELQYDEYGAGRPERLHQRLYAEALIDAGLDPDPMAHVDEVSGVSLALTNTMSLFSLNRRLRGAAAGHFAVFEASSSVPSRKIAAGLERLDFPPAVSAYFHEHVEADAVHEQLATRDVCEALVQEEPGLREDVLFGGAACAHLDALSAVDLMGRWGRDAQPPLRAVS